MVAGGRRGGVPAAADLFRWPGDMNYSSSSAIQPNPVEYPAFLSADSPIGLRFSHSYSCEVHQSKDSTHECAGTKSLFRSERLIFNCIRDMPPL